MITEDILEWVATLPKWQQKLNLMRVKSKDAAQELLEMTFG